MWPFKKKAVSAGAPFEPTAQMIEEAKLNPGGWVYQIEGAFGPDDAVPPHAIAGAWAVDSSGTLTGEFKSNPNFRRT